MFSSSGTGISDARIIVTIIGNEGKAQLHFFNYFTDILQSMEFISSISEVPRLQLTEFSFLNDLRFIIIKPLTSNFK